MTSPSEKDLLGSYQKLLGCYYTTGDDSRAHLNPEYTELANRFGHNLVDFVSSNISEPQLKDTLKQALLVVSKKERKRLMDEDKFRDISLGLIAVNFPDDLKRIVHEKELTNTQTDIAVTLVMRDVCSEMVKNTVGRDSTHEGSRA